MHQDVSFAVMNLIKSLPFVDLLGGVAQSVPYTNADQTDTKQIRKVMPVVYSIMKDSVIVTSKSGTSVIPNSSRKSVIYFEDMGGVDVQPVRAGWTAVKLTLRLVGWFNNDRLTNNVNAPLSSFVFSKIVSTITGKNPMNVANLKRLTFAVSNIPAQDASLFSKYTYDESARQYLMPPFQCMGIDIICKFWISNNCLSYINFNTGTSC